MFNTALDVIVAGYNGVTHNKENYRIVGGTGTILLTRKFNSDEVMDIDIKKVEQFIKSIK